jgi:hypothetical protein
MRQNWKTNCCKNNHIKLFTPVLTWQIGSHHNTIFQQKIFFF